MLKYKFRKAAMDMMTEDPGRPTRTDRKFLWEIFKLWPEHLRNPPARSWLGPYFGHRAIQPGWFIAGQESDDS